MDLKFSRLPPEGEKIVLASDMARMEKEAMEGGDATGEEYMDTAAAGLTDVIVSFILERELQKKVQLVTAKGNNSGDAYTVGYELLKRGFQVTSYQLFPLAMASDLCKKKANAFAGKGGEIVFIKSAEEMILDRTILMIDGLFGTGFQGEVTGLVKEVIARINQEDNLVVSIDIPSGISGETGMSGGIAIKADKTLYLAYPKVGHFYNEGFEYTGDLIGVDFGMSPSYKEKIPPFGYLVNTEMIYHNLPRFRRKENKYTAGQVILLSGSPGMPGAAILASTAALRSGAGIVRLFHHPNMDGELALLPPEVIRHGFSLDKPTEWEEELKRTKAILIGPALGRNERGKAIVDFFLAQSSVPLVIDADGLYFCKVPPAGSILTPHKGELERLLDAKGVEDDLVLLAKAEEYAKKYKVTLICKGAPTTIVSHDGPKIIIPYGNPGMASGGMGDALAGVIVAFLAGGSPPREAAILGATLHALAGDAAREIKSMHSMLASDLIEALSDLFLKIEGNS